MKRCNKCGITKEYPQFHKYSRSKDGFKNTCRACVSLYDQNEYDGKRKTARKRQGNLIQCRRCEQYLPDSEFGKRKTYCKACDNHLGHKNTIERYGLSLDEYVLIEDEQNGVCKVCNNPDNKTRLLIDNHGGKVRGLVCHTCRKLIDILDEDLELLDNLKMYLKSSTIDSEAV